MFGYNKDYRILTIRVAETAHQGKCQCVLVSVDFSRGSFTTIMSSPAAADLMTALHDLHEATTWETARKISDWHIASDNLMDFVDNRSVVFTGRL